MLTRKLKEIQIERDDKMKRQREQKAKSKLNTIEQKRRGINKTNLQPGQFFFFKYFSIPNVHKVKTFISKKLKVCKPLSVRQ